MHFVGISWLLGAEPLTPKYFLQYAWIDPMGKSYSVIDHSDHIWCSSFSQTFHSTLTTHSCCVMYILRKQFSWCTGLFSSISIWRSGSFKLRPNMPIAVQLGGEIFNVRISDLAVREKSLRAKQAGHWKRKMPTFFENIPTFFQEFLLFSCNSYCPTFFRNFCWTVWPCHDQANGDCYLEALIVLSI